MKARPKSIYISYYGIDYKRLENCKNKPKNISYVFRNMNVIRVRLNDIPIVLACISDIITSTSTVIVGTPKLIKRHKFYDGE